MKTVRIATTIRHIEESDTNVTLFAIQEILSEHRRALIIRLLGDLPTYLQFKFYAKVDKDTLSILGERLSELANSNVNLDRYNTIVQDIKRNTCYRVQSREFYNEIDLAIEAVLSPSQLQLI